MLRLYPSILICILGACTPQSPPPVQFIDVALESGIHFAHNNGATGDYYYVETFGSGAAFFDYNGDGFFDLYLVNGADLGTRPSALPPSNHLYRNLGDGHFADYTDSTASGDTGYGMGVSVADYDNDGDPDLYITNWGANALYRNEGQTFTEIAAVLGIDDRRWGTSSAFLDYDLDGDLDLFVANYVDFDPNRNPICQRGKIRTYCQPDAYVAVGDILYRNDGGHFTDITIAAGVSLVGRSLGVAPADYDLDGDTDLYVANDGTANFLYQNQRGHFVAAGLTAGTRFNADGRSEAGMGVDWGDYDNDGRPDLYVTNFANETNTLYHNTSKGYFRDISEHSGLAAPTYAPLGFGTRFLDYDNDGFLDLFTTNGHVVDQIAHVDSTQSYAQKNQMLRNLNGERFVDVSVHLGESFTRANIGRGATVADYDNDGDLDLAIGVQKQPTRLLRNDGGNKKHWLEIHLVGARHADALGARVYVEANGQRQMRQRQSGGSYLSSHDPRLHFGVNQATQARVEVIWPDGQQQILASVAVDQVLCIEQGQ